MYSIKNICLFFLLFFSGNLLCAGEISSEKSERFEHYLSIAGEFNNQSVHDSALMYYDSALLIATEFDDPAHAINLSCKLGTLLWKMDSTSLGISVIKQARKDAYKLENDTLRAKTDARLALAMSKSGDLDSAFILYDLALSNYEKAKDSIGMAAVWTNISILHKNEGNYDKAIETALKSYWITKEIDDPIQVVGALINLGNAYEILRQYDTALACFQQSYQISTDNNLTNLAYKSLTNQAVTFFRKDNFEKSKEFFLESINYYEKVGNNRELALLYSNISLVYRFLEEYETAIQYATKSVDISDKLGYPRQKIRALNNLGISYKAAGRYSEAESSYQKGLELALQAEFKKETGDVYRNLATLNELTGAYEEAYGYLLLNDSIKDILNTDEIARAIAESQTKYEVRHLRDQNKIAALEKESMRSQRNITIIIGILVVLTLFWIAVYFNLKIRKNRIIAAQKIKQLEDEKRILTAQSVIVGQEEERKRIAWELHDGIGVLLSTASIQFSSIEEDESDPKTADTFRKAQRMLDNAGKEVRRISHDMMPGVLTKFGLKEAVEDLFEEIRDLGKIDIRLNLACADERLPEDMEIMLYRVVQEMANNTIKHAQASRIDCSLIRNPQSIEIDYSDNGIGFDEESLPHDRSLGLYGIRSRIDFLSGNVELVSNEGKGSRFRIFVPLVTDVQRD